MLKILACQIDIPETRVEADKYRHLKRVCSRIDEKLTDEAVDIIVLPELTNLEYSRESFNLLAELAEPLTGQSFEIFSALAIRHQAYVVYGQATSRDGKYFITQVVIDRFGNLVGHYDKLHIAQYGSSMEKEYFERGDQVLVFEVDGIRIAPIICYDIRIPELFRTLCTEYSVQLVLHCGAYARDESFYSWHQFAMTRAIENQCFLLSLNRAGEHFGDSIFYPPWVDENSTRDNIPTTRIFPDFIGRFSDDRRSKAKIYFFAGSPG